MIIVLWVFVDGLIGDLVLVVVDGEIMVFNMNDVCLVDLDVLVLEFGYIDVYMLQYLGVIWYLMVYDMLVCVKDVFGV